MTGDQDFAPDLESPTFLPSPAPSTTSLVKKVGKATAKQALAVAAASKPPVPKRRRSTSNIEDSSLVLDSTDSSKKMFICKGYGECKMAFSRSEHLARHVRKHTGERPFQCHCGRDFSRLDNLRQHAQTVHSDTPEKNGAMMSRLQSVHNALSTSSRAKRTKSAHNNHHQHSHSLDSSLSSFTSSIGIGNSPLVHEFHNTQPTEHVFYQRSPQYESYLGYQDGSYTYTPDLAFVDNRLTLPPITSLIPRTGAQPLPGLSQYSDFVGSNTMSIPSVLSKPPMDHHIASDAYFYANNDPLSISTSMTNTPQINPDLSSHSTPEQNQSQLLYYPPRMLAQNLLQSSDRQSSFPIMVGNE